MTAVTIIYHPGSGRTTKLAEAAAKGAGSITDINVAEAAKRWKAGKA